MSNGAPAKNLPIWLGQIWVNNEQLAEIVYENCANGFGCQDQIELIDRRRLTESELKLKDLEKDSINAVRYEKLRKLNPRQFAELYERNIKGEGLFDDLVDALPE